MFLYPEGPSGCMLLIIIVVGAFVAGVWPILEPILTWVFTYFSTWLPYSIAVVVTGSIIIFICSRFESGLSESISMVTGLFMILFLAYSCFFPVPRFFPFVNTLIPNNDTESLDSWPFADNSMKENWEIDYQPLQVHEPPPNPEYTLDNLTDNNAQTAWRDIDNGEEMNIFAPGNLLFKYKGTEPTKIQDIYLINGNGLDPEAYDNHGILKKVYFSVKTSKGKYRNKTEAEVFNTAKPQVIHLEKPVKVKPGDTVVLYLRDFKRGKDESFKDLCLSEVRIE